MPTGSVRSPVPGDVIDKASRAADEAAARSGVLIRELTTPEGATAAAELLDGIWNSDGGGAAPVEPGLLIALEHAGNYVVGAYRNGEIVGAAAGFCGPPELAMMHSHIVGVSSWSKGKGIGAAMKLHQRAWCLERGVTTLEWTFDPLIFRNANFNINRLGARLEEYLPQFYGQMRDATNAGQGSDRALIRWRLAETAHPASYPVEQDVGVPLMVDLGVDGAPIFPGVDEGAVAERHGMIGLRIPADIERLRSGNSDASARWRAALRESMHVLMDAGWAVRGLRRDGTYLLQLPSPERETAGSRLL